MKIESARVIVTCPGRNFVTLKIQTDQGVHGIGDATLNGRELAVAAHSPDTDTVFPHAYHFKNGMLYPGDAIGHGVSIDEEIAARFPYKPAYLPVARLADGTMWNW
jgi:L-alanine-DL-glutamate epimerase-like enolase superfamily enzyme